MSYCYHSRMPPQPCPRCGYKLDSSTGLEGATDPRPGDFSICLNCQAVARFGPDLKFQLVRWNEVPEDIQPQILRAVLLMAKVVPVWKAAKN